MTDSEQQEQNNFKIFISYCQACRKSDVHKISDLLASKFSVWLDREKIKGDDLNDAMASGIENSDLVILCFSNDYKASVNCNKEADYADNLKKLILVVRLEDRVKFGSKFSLIFGNRHYLTLPSNLSTADIERFADDLGSVISHMLDSNKLTIIDSPEFSVKHFPRPHLFSKITGVLNKACNDIKNGPVLIYGEQQVGKTYSLSAVLKNEPNQRSFMGPTTRVAIWKNCCKWSDSEAVTDEDKEAIEASLIKLARGEYREVDCMEDLKGYKVLLIFDDVFNSVILKYVLKMSITYKLPCCIIVSDSVMQMSQMDSEFDSLFKRDRVIEIPRMKNDEMAQLIRKNYPNKKEADVKQLVLDYEGIPGMIFESANGKTTQSPTSPTKIVNPKDIVQRFVEDINQITDQSEASSSPASLAYIEVPIFNNYYPRISDEQSIIAGISETCKRPEEGLMLIVGGGGNGKSTLISSILYNSNYVNYFVKQCNFQIVIWLNCYRWNDGLIGKADEEDFVKSLLEMGSQRADKDIAKHWKTLSDMMTSFEGKRIFFVLDDCFHPSILEVFRKKTSRISPCCVITRYEESVQNGSEFAAKHLVGQLPDQEIVRMLETTFNLKDKLSSAQLWEMARSCGGSPLVATLLGSSFRVKRRNYNEEFNRIMSKDFLAKQSKNTSKGLPNNMKSEEKSAYALFHAALNQLDEDEQELYYTVVLFDPVEKIYSNHAAVMWDMTTEAANQFFEYLEEMGLARKAETDSLLDALYGDEPNDINSKSFLVHQILHEAASLSAKEHFSLMTSASIFDVRLVIVENIVQKLKKDSAHRSTLIENFVKFMEIMVDFNLSSVLENILSKFKKGSFVNYVNETDGRKKKHLSSPEVVTVAVKNGDSDLVRIITNLKIFNPTLSGVYPLHLAARKGFVDILTFLLALYPDQANLSLPESGNTILHEAAKQRNVDICKICLKANGEAISAKNSLANLPLHEAVIEKSFNVVEFLVENSPNSMEYQNNDGNTPLHLGIHSGNVKIIKFLIKKTAAMPLTANKSGKLPIHDAARLNQLGTVKLLCEKWPETAYSKNVYGDVALHEAVRMRNVEIVKFFIQEFKDTIQILNNDGNSSLHDATQFADLETVELLHDHWPEATGLQNTSGDTVLHEAVRRGGHLEMVIYLTERNPDLIHVKNWAYKGRYPLKRGRSNGGSIPLHEAARFASSLEIVEFLVEKSPESVKQVNDDGNSAFHEVALNLPNIAGRLAIVDFLYSKWREGLLLRNHKGNTPLHEAAQDGNIKLTKHLAGLEGNAMKITNNEGALAIDIARQAGHDKLVDALLAE